MAKQQTLNGKQANGSEANVGFEDNSGKAADKLRNDTDAAENKHAVFLLFSLKTKRQMLLTSNILVANFKRGQRTL